MLPPEYGGTGSSVDDLTKYWMDQVTFLVVFGPIWYVVVLCGAGSSVDDLKKCWMEQVKRETLLLIAGTFGRPAYQLKPIENDKFCWKSVCLLEWWMLIAQRSHCKSHFWKASTVPFVRLNTSVTGSWPRAGIFSNAICKLLRLPRARFVY